jgi:putative membrane protein (TIGR04086 family)
MVKMSEGTMDSPGNNIKRIIKGSIFSIGITIILLLIFAAILTYTSVSEKTIPIVVLAITGISILIGSQISTIRIRKNGIVNGGLIGLTYIITIYLISSIINGNFNLNIYSGIMIGISILARYAWTE